MARSLHGIHICQRNYSLDILADSGTIGSAPARISFDPNVTISKEDEELLTDVTFYKRLLERLLYLTISWPNLEYSIQLLTILLYLTITRMPHLRVAHKVFRYIKRKPGQMSFYPTNSKLKLERYCDTNWGAYLRTRKSGTSYNVFIGTALVS